MTELELRDLFNSTQTTLKKWKVLHSKGKDIFAMQKTIGKNHGVPTLYFITLRQDGNIIFKSSYKLTSKNDFIFINSSIANDYDIEFFNKLLA